MKEVTQQSETRALFAQYHEQLMIILKRLNSSPGMASHAIRQLEEIGATLLNSLSETEKEQEQ